MFLGLAVALAGVTQVSGDPVARRRPAYLGVLTWWTK
jgi:hypothetical protein